MPIADDTMQPTITHYQLDDGTVWDISQATFLPTTSNCNIPKESLARIPDDDGCATATALRDYLVSCNLPLGKLEPTDQPTYRFYTLRDERLDECLEQLQASNWVRMTPDMQERWRIYYHALKHLPEQEGFPWDGGLDNTPWPEHPLAWTGQPYTPST